MDTFEIPLDRLRGADAIGAVFEQPPLDAHHDTSLRPEDTRAQATSDPGLGLDLREVMLDLGLADGMHGHEVGVVGCEALDVHDVEGPTTCRERPVGTAREARALECVAQPIAASRE